MSKLVEMRIDKTKVSHIEIRDSFKGIDSEWGVEEYKFCEEKKSNFLWFNFIKYEEGFWKNGKQVSSVIKVRFDKEKILENKRYRVISGEVYTKVCVSIYIEEELIKKQYFEDLESAYRYCDNNFPNINFKI